MRIRRTLVVLGVAVVAVALLPTAASAHVTLQPGSQPKGASDVIVGFAIPNESTNNASTNKVEIDFPTSTPMLGVNAEAIPGWSAAVEMVQLAKPITTGDGQISQAVSKVTWRAVGEGYGPNQYMLFSVLVGTLPSNTNQLVFKALQTYSDGTVVSWIEPTVKGAPAPEHPTPILKLTKKTSR
jgi:uncharacterized protein YcnI